MRKIDRFKSFIKGIASVMDIFGVGYLEYAHDILNRTDAEALQDDWQAVGNDLKVAMDKLNG